MLSKSNLPCKIYGLFGGETNHAITLQLNSCIPGHLSQRRHFHTKTCTWMLIAALFYLKTENNPNALQWVNNPAVCPYHVILLSEKWPTDTCNSVDGFQESYAEWNTAIPEDNILNDFIYAAFLKWQNYRNGEQISDCQRLRKE